MKDEGGKCSCDKGKTLISGECRPCEDGRFKDHAGTNSCEICDSKVIHGAFETMPGSESDKSSSKSCACGKGKYQDPRKTDEAPEVVCSDCMDLDLSQGVKCKNKGLTLKNLTLKDGFWRNSVESSKIVECDIVFSCAKEPGAPPTKLCADGHTGPICSACTDGYNKNEIEVCRPCASAGVSIGGIYVLFGVFATIVFYLVLRKILGKENLFITKIIQEITKATEDDKHWSKRLKT
ncbi:hypothetical protein TL16_g06591 [Triparma laevis f. inornata]|uniref:Tyrosine-protein kinase ephrin type A/B receptor-like domain-containing protein n=1 Tax=Triparma laevis f. inornata TaxID=1714386 RepID=A0A9W7EEB6_9STRA|nr:hypothetical protein TL16_g06591 [Triparma laevis f. inornata]